MKSIFKKNYWVAWIITLITIILIFCISSIPDYSIPKIDFEYKNQLYHFGIFMTLAFFSMIAFSKGGRNKDFVYVAIIFSVIFAIMDELHQSLVFGRNTSIGDFLIDCLGIFTAFLLNKSLK